MDHSLVYMQSTSCEMEADESQPGIKIARININNLGYVDNTTLMEESEEEINSFWIKLKEESEKPGLNSSKITKIMTSSRITSWQIEKRTIEAVTDFIF